MAEPYNCLLDVNEALADRFQTSHSLTNDTFSVHETVVESSVEDFNQTEFLVPFGELISPNVLGMSDLVRSDNLLPPGHRNMLTCREEIINPWSLKLLF